MLEDEMDHRGVVSPGDGFDELVMVLAGHPKIGLHSIIGRIEKRMSDPCVIDQDLLEAGLQKDAVCHVADGRVEAVVFEVQGFAVSRLQRSAKPLLALLELGELARFEIQYRQPSDRLVNDRGNEEKIPERRKVHGDDARAPVLPDDDVAFLRLSVARDGARIEEVTGAERFGAGWHPPAPVQVVGYPDGADQPVSCTNQARSFAAAQLEFDCGGYTDGTSGSPFLADVSAASRQGTVVGVIGGYEQGGDTPDVSYSSAFGPAVEALYRELMSASG